MSTCPRVHDFDAEAFLVNFEILCDFGRNQVAGESALREVVLAVVNEQEADGDQTSLRSELDGVRHEIADDLLDAEFVHVEDSLEIFTARMKRRVGGAQGEELGGLSEVFDVQCNVLLGGHVLVAVQSAGEAL